MDFQSISLASFRILGQPNLGYGDDAVGGDDGLMADDEELAWPQQALRMPALEEAEVDEETRREQYAWDTCGYMVLKVRKTPCWPRSWANFILL